MTAGAGQIDLEFWRARRVLVTGHTGFKGSWLSLWLQSIGTSITGLSSGAPTDPSLYELARVAEGMAGEVTADIRDPLAVSRGLQAADPDVVIHMAAQPLVRRSYVDPRGTFETNVMGSVNVLEAVRAAPGVRVLVLVTSDKCYENRGWDWAYRESDRLGGEDPYSCSKGAAELVTASYRRSFFSSPESARLASARAGNVIGGGDWGEERLVPDIVRARDGRHSLMVRNPDAVRAWQHVLNPLSGYLLLAQSLWSSAGVAGSWNFGPSVDDARPVWWIVEQLRERWSGEPTWEHDPQPQPPEAQLLKLDSSRARARLGWRPMVRLDTAIDSIADWYNGLREGADMRALTLSQITDLTAAGVVGR